MNHFLLKPLLLLGILISCSQSITTTGKTTTANNASGHILYENKTFAEGFNLLSLAEADKISPTASVAYCPQAITFVNCTFSGPVVAFANNGAYNTRMVFEKSLSFINCTFSEEATFRGATVGGLAIFDGSTFSSEADFQSSVYMGNGSFSACKFLKNARFQNSQFNGTANFMDAQFSSQALFQGCWFGRNAQFGVAKFYGYTDFSLCEFKGSAFFNYAELVERSLFSDSWFSRRAEFLKTVFNQCETARCTFEGETNFADITVSTSLNFTESMFYRGIPSFDPVYASLIDTGRARQLQMVKNPL